MVQKTLHKTFGRKEGGKYHETKDLAQILATDQIQLKASKVSGWEVRLVYYLCLFTPPDLIVLWEGVEGMDFITKN